jgi:hypothetical protein
MIRNISGPLCYFASAMAKFLSFIALVFILAGCGSGVTGPCAKEDQDPTGICANSHGEVD